MKGMIVQPRPVKRPADSAARQAAVSKRRHKVTRCGTVRYSVCVIAPFQYKRDSLLEEAPPFSHTLDAGLAETVEWYLTNRTWWERVISEAYRAASEMYLTSTS